MTFLFWPSRLIASFFCARLCARSALLVCAAVLVTGCIPSDNQANIQKRTTLIYLSQQTCSELSNSDIESPECQSLLKANSSVVLRVPRYLSWNFRFGVSAFDVVREGSLVIWPDRIVAFDGQNYAEYKNRDVKVLRNDNHITPNERRRAKATQSDQIDSIEFVRSQESKLRPVPINRLEFAGGQESNVSLGAIKRRLETTNGHLGEYQRTPSTLDTFEMYRPRVCIEAANSALTSNQEASMPTGCALATIFFTSQVNKDVGVICQTPKAFDGAAVIPRLFCRLHGQFQLRLVKGEPFYINYSYPVDFEGSRPPYSWAYAHERLQNWFKSMDVTDQVAR
jgi:hypothetical protein